MATFIKIKWADEKRWSFLTSGGGTSYTRIHAAPVPEDKAAQLIAELEADNEGLAAKAVN